MPTDAAVSPLNGRIHQLTVDELDMIVEQSRALFEEEGAPPPPLRRHRTALFRRLERGHRALLWCSSGSQGPSPTGPRGGRAHGDAPLAFAFLRPAPARIEQFRVAPGARRQGVGRAFVDAILREALPGTDPVTVAVLTDNAAALAFWRRLARACPRLRIDARERPV